MKRTPLPLLRHLAPNVHIVRCGLCNELVLASEACESIEEAPLCPSREQLGEAKSEVPATVPYGFKAHPALGRLV